MGRARQNLKNYMKTPEATRTVPAAARACGRIEALEQRGSEGFPETVEWGEIFGGVRSGTNPGPLVIQLRN